MNKQNSKTKQIFYEFIFLDSLLSSIKENMKTLPELATNLMKEWYEAHCDKPYPTESERQELARLGQITESQVTIYIKHILIFL